VGTGGKEDDDDVGRKRMRERGYGYKSAHLLY